MNSAPETAFFTLAALLTAISLWRELPLQYVITASAVMFALSALACLVLKEPCWWLPLVVLNSRGVSRLILYRWRERPYYGWWIMGLTCVLTTLVAPRWITPALALAMQIATVPWLIKRRPAAEGPSWFSLVNWVLIAVWFLFVTAA